MPFARSLLAVIIALGFVTRLPAAEPWSDPRLKVTEGLALWLDASTEGAARTAAGEAKPKAGSELELWHDGSGNARNVVQSEAESRPTWQAVEEHPVVRFDGTDDHLTVTNLRKESQSLTLFIVAAPYSNRGGFRGLCALNRNGENDYTSGLTIDQLFSPTQQFTTVNVEGAGFNGAQDLMRETFDYGTFHTLCVTVEPSEVELFVDGGLSGRRPREAVSLAMDRFTVGARFFTNGARPVVRGFFEGDVAELLVYGRALEESERKAVDEYLSDKYRDLAKVRLKERALPPGAKRLVNVPAPPVQMFVPGFTPHELPLELNNINNLKYRDDGKLVALAYDGNIYLLSDSDGDGLEDRAALFWDNQGRLRAPIGMDLTPAGSKHGNGVFVASKGKCSLIVDTDGDDKADREIVIARGWPELPHGVDALGVACDRTDGSVYFGLGTTNFTAPYLIDADGQAQYRLTDEHGTILRVAPDLKSREIVCTGIRFPVALAFHPRGDLFCTDQEGATWVPNGNPFDELLHIQKGRHYGFPPRHPRHLPNVIDEPSVFDYVPQHQSTCGLTFNTEGLERKAFGPAHWKDDALVCGYSRGKLYRTSLVPTAAGYVAQTQQIASLSMLLVDSCVSPEGDLVLAVHSGSPDWGSGPGGAGKLFKVRYTDREHPQPVLAWAQGMHEVRIAFDRPLRNDDLRGLTSGTSIEFGTAIGAGDRFEALRPGYQVVADQIEAPRFDLKVHSVGLSADRRTLIVNTDRQTRNAGYAVTLPRTAPSKSEKALRQVAAIDLGYRLDGVEAVWTAAEGNDTWTGWLPHLDLDVSRALTRGSAPHEELWERLKRPGELRLKCRLDLWHMLRPAVQPGSKIDYEWPEEKVTLTLTSTAAMAVLSGDRRVSSQAEESANHRAQLTVGAAESKVVPLELTVRTGPATPRLQVAWHTNEDARPRALPLSRIRLPWVTESTEQTAPAPLRPIAELEGGDWGRGRALFFGDQAGCAKCHAIHGQGGTIGPDLSNLSHRDYASVLRDVTEPSAAVNPDYIAHTIVLTDGRVLTGTLRTRGDRLEVGNEQGKLTAIAREEIETLQPSTVSIMPRGIPQTLGREKLRDLMTYLLTPAPHMPDYGPNTPPKARTEAEVAAVLAGSTEPEGTPRRLHIVLVAGAKDHGPGEHDYPAWQQVWKRLLSADPTLRVTTADDWPESSDLESADVLVFYQKGTWSAERARDIDAFLARGGGLVYLHYAVDGGADPAGFAERIGLAWQGGRSKFRHGPLELHFDRGSKHPIARNFQRVRFYDESYWQLVGNLERVDLLATGDEEGRPQPLFWTVEHGGGRVFVSILGHFSWTFDDPLFRVLVFRGIAWSAGEPVDRFNALVPLGARLEKR